MQMLTKVFLKKKLQNLPYFGGKLSTHLDIPFMEVANTK
jgi:hypothetical protein